MSELEIFDPQCIRSFLPALVLFPIVVQVQVVRNSYGGIFHPVISHHTTQNGGDLLRPIPRGKEERFGDQRSIIDTPDLVG